MTLSVKFHVRGGGRAPRAPVVKKAKKKKFLDNFVVSAGMWCLYCRIKSGRGMVSRRMLEHLLLMFVCRTTCTSLYSGYLPIDCSGDYAYQLFDLSGLLGVCRPLRKNISILLLLFYLLQRTLV